MYLVAILCPPLAVFFTGKPFQALINIILSLAFYFPGLIHAIMVVKDSKDEKRHKELVKTSTNSNIEEPKKSSKSLLFGIIYRIFLLCIIIAGLLVLFRLIF